MAFCVSDESVNTHGYRVLQSGADTDAFERNPIMLYMHRRGKVIGKWENLRWEEGKLYVDEVFDLADKSEEGGEEIGGKVERGFLRAASIGLIVLEAIWNDVLQCADVVKWRLQEISIVDVGSNANALQFYDQAGEPLSELQLSQLLETFRPASTTPQTPQTITMERATILTALCLAATATDADIMNQAAKAAGFDALKKENEELKLAAKKTLDQEANTLVTEAVNEKRISAEQKDIYLKLFAADHDTAKQALAALAKPKDLVELAARGTAQDQSQEQSNNEADVKRFDELDKSGKLLKLAQEDNATFKRLFKAKYGVEPTNVQV